MAGYEQCGQGILHCEFQQAILSGLQWRLHVNWLFQRRRQADLDWTYGLHESARRNPHGLFTLALIFTG